SSDSEFARRHPTHSLALCRSPSPPARAAAVAAGRRPSPLGRGRIVLRLSITSVPECAKQPSEKHQSDVCCSLSLRERVRARGKYSVEHAKCSISQGLLSKRSSSLRAIVGLGGCGR